MTVEYQIRDFIGADNAGGMTSINARAAITDMQSLLVGDEVRQWIREGRVFHAYEGELTTPATFAPATLIRQQPQFMVRTAAGVVIIPLLSMFALEATSAVVEVLVSCCDNDPGVDNMTEVEPINANSRFAGVLVLPTAPTQVTRVQHLLMSPTFIASTIRRTGTPLQALLRLPSSTTPASGTGRNASSVTTMKSMPSCSMV